MTPLEIKIELLRRSKCQAEIARSITPPVSRQTVNLAIQKNIGSIRVLEAVAQAVGKNVFEVFPGRCRRSKPATARNGKPE